MDKDITTTSIKNSPNHGLDSSGKIKETIGYTVNENPSKNERGHYSFNGADEIDPENKFCYAKKTIIEDPDGKTRNKYYVKAGTDGKIFNPWGMFSEGTQGKYSKGRGKSEWSFVVVTEKCFEFYSKFLQSRNSAWLTSAEREMI